MFFFLLQNIYSTFFSLHLSCVYQKKNTISCACGTELQLDNMLDG